jgi:hypothetical protein
VKIESDFHEWAATPPMGWNSWDCYGPTVTEKEVKENADYMAKYLKKFGWEYIVIDIRCYIENDKAHGYNEIDPIYNMDEYGRLLPAINRFPSSAENKGFKPIADYIHNLGLKFGIHIMRGIPVQAVKKNTPILNSKARAEDIYSSQDQCPWLKDMYTIVSYKKGAQEYYNSIFNLYASWGVDYVKVDDLSSPYYQQEIEMIRKAIDNCGRKIVFSASPGETPIIKAEHARNHINLWRIVSDFWDNWIQLKEHFDICNRWAPLIGNGNWPDPDILPLGRIGIRAENGNDRMTKLTPDEQISLMTLSAIFRSPLMFGGDLPSNDPFTLSLLTNEEILMVNQKSLNNKQLFRNGDLIAWIADEPETNNKYLALFNAEDQIDLIENKAIWKSDVISWQKPNQYVDVNINITDATKIYLVVSNAGDDSNWDHADWIEPTLSGSKGKLKLTDISWVKATAGWGGVIMNKTVLGKILTIGGKEYSYGIGTHAVSIIEYDIPEGYTKFTAKTGLDDESVNQGGATIKFLIFTQDPSGLKPADSVKIPIKLEQLGLNGTCSIRDLWDRRELGKFKDEFAPFIKRHSARLYKISQVNYKN